MEIEKLEEPLEFIKFNALDNETRIVYCSYRIITNESRGNLLQRTFPYDQFIEKEPRVAEMLKGMIFSIYLEETPTVNYTEKKWLDGKMEPLTEDEADYCRDLIKRATVGQEWDDLLKPPSVDEQVEEFIKEFFEETDEPVEQKDYLEEFFKELEIEDDETSESKNT